MAPELRDLKTDRTVLIDGEARKAIANRSIDLRVETPRGERSCVPAHANWSHVLTQNSFMNLMNAFSFIM